jgi:hypothetical protein
VAAENLYQHAEHYFRVMNANGDANAHDARRPVTPADIEVNGAEGERPRVGGSLASASRSSASSPMISRPVSKLLHPG